MSKLSVFSCDKLNNEINKTVRFKMEFFKIKFYDFLKIGTDEHASPNIILLAMG